MSSLCRGRWSLGIAYASSPLRLCQRGSLMGLHTMTQLSKSNEKKGGAFHGGTGPCEWRREKNCRNIENWRRGPSGGSHLFRLQRGGAKGWKWKNYRDNCNCRKRNLTVMALGIDDRNLKNVRVPAKLSKTQNTTWIDSNLNWVGASLEVARGQEWDILDRMAERVGERVSKPCNLRSWGQSRWIWWVSIALMRGWWELRREE